MSIASEASIKDEFQKYLGLSRLSFANYRGRVEIYLPGNDLTVCKDIATALPALCSIHGSIHRFAGEHAKDYPSLTLVVDNPDAAPMFVAPTTSCIVLSLSELTNVFADFARKRINGSFLHEVGHIIQKLFKLNSNFNDRSWPAFAEGTATILGFQLLDCLYKLPDHCYGGTFPDAKCISDLAPFFIDRGLTKLRDGATGQIGLTTYVHSAGSVILEAALFDLIYNHIHTAAPLSKACESLRLRGEAQQYTTHQANFEAFFEAFALAANRNIAPYLLAWKFELESLPEKLVHLPPLDATLPQWKPNVPVTVDISEQKKRDRRPEAAFSQVGVEAITVSLGKALAAEFLEAATSEITLDRINDVRREIARETGMVIPGIHLRDDIYLDPLGYVLYVRDHLAAKNSLYLDKSLALGNDSILGELQGDETREPVYGLKAKWITTENLTAAREKGAMVFDPLAVLTSHLGQVARDHLSILIGRQEFTAFIEHMRTKAPALLSEIGTPALPISGAHKAYRFLLHEKVWPRDPIVALESIIEASETHSNPRDWAEAARKKLVPALLRRKKFRSMRVAMLDAAFDEELLTTLNGASILPDKQVALYLLQEFKTFAASQPAHQAFLLCTTPLRPILADLVLRSHIDINVYAFCEIPHEFEVKPHVVIKREAALLS